MAEVNLPEGGTVLTFALSATALATELDFACGEGGPIVGLPGLTVNCVAAPPLDAVYDDVSWRFGDGATATGLAVSHTYEVEGQFTVSARLEGWAPLDTADAEVPESEEYGLVTICGPPEPRFEWEQLGGLDLQLLNRTPPDPRCIIAIQWDVFEGRGTDGEPIFTFDSWEPALTLPDEGEYTIVLTVGGLAGTEAWKSEFDARYVLPDALYDGQWSVACDGTGGLGLGALAPTLLLVLRRRRR